MESKWTAEEDRIVGEIYRTGGPLKSHMEKLPGRSYDSIKTRAWRIGHRKHESKPWTARETKILTRIWTADGNLKAATRLLPDRTYNAIIMQSIRMGIPAGQHGAEKGYSWVDEEIETLLKRAGPFTCIEIANHIGASERQVRMLTRRDSENKYYIDSWRHLDNGPIALWAYGKNADEPRPAPQSKSTELKKWRRKNALKIGAGNPFATLMAQIGIVGAMPIADDKLGRVYQQDMTVRADELEIAA